MSFHVFAFGSLMFDPEHADALERSEPAVLEGHSRAFNKASVPRACPPGQLGWPELDVPSFFDRGRPVSLALGTRPGGAMRGRLLRYPAALAEQVTRTLHRREGVYPGRARNHWSYVPATLPVTREDGSRVDALVYLSNPEGDWHADGLDVPTTVRVLVRATPRQRQPRALGVWYLVETWLTLRRGGVEDAHLDALIDELRQHHGPWLDVLPG